MTQRARVGVGEGEVREAVAGAPLRGCGVVISPLFSTRSPLRVRAWGPALAGGIVSVPRVRARPFSARLAPWERASWERPLTEQAGEHTATLAPCGRHDDKLVALWVECDARALREGEATLFVEVSAGPLGPVTTAAFLARVRDPASSADEHAWARASRELSAPPGARRHEALRRALRAARRAAIHALPRVDSRAFRAHALFAREDRAAHATLSARPRGRSSVLVCGARGRSLVEAWLRGELRALSLEALSGEGHEGALRVSLEALPGGTARVRVEAREEGADRGRLARLTESLRTTLDADSS